MSHKWMWVGMLALVIAGESACKKETPVDPAVAAQACAADTDQFKNDIGDDAFIDHLRAMRTGDLSPLASVSHLKEKWATDGCEKQTGQPVDLVAKAGLYSFYEEHCEPINPTVQDVKDMIHEAALSKDPEDAEMVALIYICYNVHHTDNKDLSDTTSL